MKILVAYATNSSGTLVASKVIAETLSSSGFDIVHKDIRNVKPETFQNYDLIILGSPSWNYEKTEGMPHEFMSTFMKRMEGSSLPQKQFAVFGLGDTAYMYFCGAVDHMETFINKLGGQLILPSLRIDGFFFNQNENEKILSAWADAIAAKLKSGYTPTPLPSS